MKEIAGNLHRDVKDLLDESANIVTGIFKNGLCTVRGAARRWRDFTRDISGAFVSLFKSTNDALLPDLFPHHEPVVTVMESMDDGLPVGTQMGLYEAETRIQELNQSYWDSDRPAQPVTVRIDYMMDGEVDRYWLPLHVGQGCDSMLAQMKSHVEANLNDPAGATTPFYDAPVGLQELLHEKFGPQLQADLEKLSTRVLDLFQQHYTITRLEQQFGKQAQIMPEKERIKFLRSMRENISELRTAANTGQTQERAQERASPAPARDGDKPRQSVKVKLRQIKQERAKVPARVKSRSVPQR